MKNLRSLKIYVHRALTILACFFLLAACSSDNEPNTDAIISGVIKVEVTYPTNFMDYQLEVFTAVALFDATKIATVDSTIDYLNDSDFVPMYDHDSFDLVGSNVKHTFQTANYALSLSMWISSKNTSSTLEEGVPVNLKIYLNNVLQEELNLTTTRGDFDFTWTPTKFLYNEF